MKIITVPVQQQQQRRRRKQRKMLLLGGWMIIVPFFLLFHGAYGFLSSSFSSSSPLQRIQQQQQQQQQQTAANYQEEFPQLEDDNDDDRMERTTEKLLSYAYTLQRTRRETRTRTMTKTTKTMNNNHNNNINYKKTNNNNNNNKKNTNMDTSTSDLYTQPVKSLVAYLSHHPQVIPTPPPSSSSSSSSSSSKQSQQQQQPQEDDVDVDQMMMMMKLKTQKTQNNNYNNQLNQLIVACERSIIQGIRICGEVGDYKLILRLIESSLVYANDYPILTSRIFGEAIDTLATSTTSNISKIKYIWNLIAYYSYENEEVKNNNNIDTQHITLQKNDKTTTKKKMIISKAKFLQSPVTAYELNVMLKALASRGKIGACIDLYRQHTTSTSTTTTAAGGGGGIPIGIIPDAYTAVTLFTILTESIRPGQTVTLPPPSLPSPSSSPSAQPQPPQDPNQDKLSSTTHTKTVSSSSPSFSSSSSSPLKQSLIELSSTAGLCWQWNTAIELWDSFDINNNNNNNEKANNSDDTTTSRSSSSFPWNNQMFGALLKLYDRAAVLQQQQQEQEQEDVIVPTTTSPTVPVPRQNSNINKNRSSSNYGPQIALTILESMMEEYNILPDVMTCTLAMKIMGSGSGSGGGGRGRSSSSSAISSSSSFLLSDRQSWKMAVQLLEEMKSDDTTLPKPNVYSYSVAIMSCARCNAYPEALKLLNEMRTTANTANTTEQSSSSSSSSCWYPPSPNTWVYNVALLAIAGHQDGTTVTTLAPYLSRKQQNRRSTLSRKKQSLKKKEDNLRERRSMALHLLEQMDELAQQQGIDTKPDTITYNTVLGIIATTNLPSEEGNKETKVVDDMDHHSDSGGSGSGGGASTASANTNTTTETLVVELLNQMKERKILRDAITYHNAILALRDGDRIIEMVDTAVEDSDSIEKSLRTTTGKSSSSSSTSDSLLQVPKLDGKAAEGLTFVFNSALSVLAGDWKKFNTVFSKMQKNNVKMNDDTTIYVINALGRSGFTSVISSLLNVLSGNHTEGMAIKNVLEESGVDLSSGMVSLPLKGFHYSEAISVCLVANEFEEAHRILSLMRQKQMNPTNQCLEKFSLAYARLAVQSPSKKVNHRQDPEYEQNEEEGPLRRMTSRQDNSKSRAFSAYSIAMALNNPPSFVLCGVAKACAVAGMWDEARSILSAIHQNILDKITESVAVHRSDVVLVPSLHKALLRQTAKQGNVTAALWYCDDIQRLSRKMRTIKDAPTRTAPAHRRIDVVEGGSKSVLSSLLEMSSSVNLPTPVIVGMKGDDWVFVLTAAAKSGNWRVCLKTLQFLRPFLEKTRPSGTFGKGADDVVSLRRYEQLAPALTTVIRCLEQHSQHAWAIRAIDDWMEWSGRRPQLEAVSAAMRLLSAQGWGEEVNSMLLRCILQGGTSSSNVESGKASYEEVLCIRAIVALHHNGLYDDADEAFLSGVTQGHLLFPLEKQDDKVVLDLHGMNVALAHSAVRVAMRQQALVLDYTAGGDDTIASDMIIVTGRGWNSAIQMRPVLRPEVQRMLLEEFYPPLNTVSVPQNMGALVVLAEDISAWQTFQQEQKGARMLALADVLKKNLSSVSLLRQSIAMAVAESKSHLDEEEG